jgi:flagellar hook-associated protein 1 FlgK
MPGLNTSMNIAVQALIAEQGALDVTTNNIANINTPGYSRELAVFQSSPTVQEGNIAYGTGATLQQFQSVRDQMLQLRIYQENGGQGNAQAQLDSLNQIQTNFADPSQGVGGALSVFFNSLSQLSTNPTDTNARQQVLSAANNLANAFHQSASALGQIQSGLDQTVPQTVNQINQLTDQIAKLNGQVAQMQGLGQDPGVTQDQRDQLVQQLSQLVNVSVTQTDHGITVTTANGVPLVVAGQSFALQSGTASGAMQGVFAAGQDITSQIQGGKLGGVLQVRDTVIPDLLSQLDTLASQFTASFNAANQSGFDLSGNPGGAFFTPSATVAGSASNFGVAINDPSLIAASSDGSPGSNGNVAQLIAVRDQALPSGVTPTGAYANLVLAVGNYGSNAQANVTASGASLRQLTDQRNAVSGVSLDEESTNMLQYQRAYQAAARVVTTVDSMMQTLLSMGVTG